MLQRLIDSYFRLKVPSDISVNLLIVENDSQPNCKSLVEAESQNGLLPIDYYHEPRLGIPIARNRCVKLAINRNQDYIAFIDDDEWFTDSWLETIWQYHQTQPPNSVIQGSVKSELPADAPKHLYPFFQRKDQPTGQKLHMCRTNNVLVPLSLFTHHGLLFDESRPFAGGTDSKLFRAAHALGVPLIYCSEAMVYEEVPRTRLSYRWLSKRYFRIGLTMGEHIVFQHKTDRIPYTLKLCLSSVKYSLKAIVYFLILKKEKHMRSWIKACQKLGEGLGPWGIKVDSYRKVEGS